MVSGGGGKGGEGESDLYPVARIFSQPPCLQLFPLRTFCGKRSLPLALLLTCPIMAYLMMIISSFLSSCYEKATDVLCIGRIQIRFIVDLISEFSA